jgi:rubrerythrin
MKKVCNVCGYSIENDHIRECPNCGSYDLKKVQSERDRSGRFRIGKW